MAKLTPVTQEIVDRLRWHIAEELPQRKRDRYGILTRAGGKRFVRPLWEVIQHNQQLIDSAGVMAIQNAKARGELPFTWYTSGVKLTKAFTTRICKRVQLTDLQWSELGCAVSAINPTYLLRSSTAGYVDHLFPPETVLSIAQPFNGGEKYDYDAKDDHLVAREWWTSIRKDFPFSLPIRAVLDRRITELILIKVLDMTAMRRKHANYRTNYNGNDWMCKGA